MIISVTGRGTDGTADELMAVIEITEAHNSPAIGRTTQTRYLPSFWLRNRATDSSFEFLSSEPSHFLIMIASRTILVSLPFFYIYLTLSHYFRHTVLRIPKTSTRKINYKSKNSRIVIKSVVKYC